MVVKPPEHFAVNFELKTFIARAVENMKLKNTVLVPPQPFVKIILKFILRTDQKSLVPEFPHQRERYVV